MTLELDKAHRLALKKQAHHLKPVVQSGAAGITPAVLAEIDRALNDHELIKIKLVADDKPAFKACVATVCESLDAVSIQEIGRMATIYRPNPDADNKNG
ncbi:YhbY family RNA-binding protein [uncultured Salinisphaera sp.]|uniref:YhbY family RNA-binding protein n=1 Tax=uncultured Salinisphaera sp. TaxID=359372 RepID=UPI0032B11C87|tara:strand:+ start:191 stop:487 length:297 start_codon:yes stop_codon:yes gene_type:complete